jgi:two-component system, OmpR family, phosphate regulon sensor histidine kinase PhoR
MSPRPVLVRLLLPFAGMIVLIVALCGGVVYYSTGRMAAQNQARDLARLTEMVRRDMLANSQSMGQAQFDRLRTHAEALDVRITLIDGQGLVVFDSQADPSKLDRHAKRPEIVDARRTGHGHSRRHSDSVDRDMIYMAELVDPAQPNGYVLRLSYPRDLFSDVAASAAVIVAGSVLASVLLVVMLALLLYREWIGPTKALSEAAHAMAQGKWDVRVQPRGAEDLRSFSSRLNIAAAHAQKQLADLRGQRGDLQALVDTLPDPIIGTDSAGVVVLINTPASRLLDVSPAQARGKKLVAAISNEPILQLYEAVRDGRVAPVHADGGNGTDVVAATATATATPSIQREIRLNRSGQRLTFQAFAARTPGGGVLIVLRDISSAANAVQMKTDFVANASHELRTPIAAIKIAFETIKDVYHDDPDQTDRCIGIIDGHLRRLEEMLSDLLDLSRVENAEQQPAIGPVKINELFAMVRGTMLPLARQKGVELKFDEDHRIPELVSDARLLNLILRNLVENAIKFTPAGGSVTVAVDSGQDEKVAMRVTDTGIGIPPEHIDRVFERFYQVDPARSGSAGRGTGLGLAIVKHAVHALGGTVTISSMIGQGTAVTCLFPPRA